MDTLFIYGVFILKEVCYDNNKESKQRGLGGFHAQTTPNSTTSSGDGGDEAPKPTTKGRGGEKPSGSESCLRVSKKRKMDTLFI